MNDPASYLREVAGVPFAWGLSDCCLFAADWVLRLRGVDPAAAFRGRYASERGALRLIAEAGGLLPLVAPAMVAFEATGEPSPGDVGLVETRGPSGLLLMAIRTRLGWACKSPAGVIVTSADFRSAWAL